MNRTEMSAALRKEITALRQAKHRRRRKLFVAEGTRCVDELADTFRCRHIVATAAWIERNEDKIPASASVCEVTRHELERLTALSTPQEVLAVFEIPEYPDLSSVSLRGLTVALDNVQDPGNLGTIIRACDWYGVSTLICSPGTADVFSPKVVQATMGAIGRVNIFYADLTALLRTYSGEIYGTFLDGADIYSENLSSDGIIVMGNEGNGISDEVSRLVNRRLYLPPWPVDGPHVESLNVAMATAIALSIFRHP